MQCRSWIIFRKGGNIIRSLSRNRLCTGYVESVCKEKCHWKPMHSATVLRNREIWPWTVCLIFTARKRRLCNRRIFYKNLPLEHEGNTLTGKKTSSCISRTTDLEQDPVSFSSSSSSLYIDQYARLHGRRRRKDPDMLDSKPKTRIVGMTI